MLQFKRYKLEVPFIVSMSEHQDRKTEEEDRRIEQNRLTLMSLSSGEEARRARGKEEIKLPSQKIADSPSIEQVESSGKEAQRRREDKKG